MQLTKAIIVDDEEDARKVLSTLISFSDFPIDIVASCGTLKIAVKAIKELEPDVVFLDIEMPNYAGYEIINFFDEINFEIVFVTAYDKYALKAFELSATDYLVKPVNRSRLNETLKRVTENANKKSSIAEYEVILKSLQTKTMGKIVIPEIGGNRVLLLKDIICIQGQGNYADIFQTNGQKLTVSKNLKYFQNVLPEDVEFFRSQKSWIINLDHLKRFNLSTGDLEMINGIIAKLSPGRIPEFEKTLKA
ncbi:MAG: two-component system LytT family response regulator [Salibacteraceae bacterium]|jgi:two-component system LytT family response regulator